MQIKIQYTLYSTKDNLISLWILYTVGITKIILNTQYIIQAKHLWAVSVSNILI